MAIQTFQSLYLEHNKEFESPTSFWKWSAYAAIAAVLRDNCYLVAGNNRVYPNIYVMLLANSGGRKGPPIGLSQTLVNKINNTKVISGRASIQGVLDELARSETDEKTGKLIKGGTAIFYAKELAAGIVGDQASVDILTDIYDYDPNPYKHILRTGPKFKIDCIILNMLVGSNEIMLKSFMDNKAIMGGLLARTFVIIADEWRPGNSLLNTNNIVIEESKKRLLEALRKIADLKGEFVISKETEKTYNDWYLPFREKYKDKSKNKAETSGVVERLHFGVLKLALIKAANELTLNVEKHHVDESIDECIGLIPNYNSLVMNTGKSNIAEAGSIVLTKLLHSRDFKESKKVLIRENWMHFDAETLDKLIITFEAGGLITRRINCNEEFYELTTHCINVMKGV